MQNCQVHFEDGPQVQETVLSKNEKCVEPLQPLPIEPYRPHGLLGPPTPMNSNDTDICWRVLHFVLKTERWRRFGSLGLNWLKLQKNTSDE